MKTKEKFKFLHEVGKTLRELHIYSMIEINREGISVHRLVQQALRASMGEKLKKNS